MPKKEICINTGIEISLENVFNFSTPEQVYDKLVKICEESVKPFKKKIGEPSRLLFKTKKYANDVSVQVHFMRIETDEEYEQRRINMRLQRKMEKLKNIRGANVEVKLAKKKISRGTKADIKNGKINV
jgi:hypothetical protein